MSQEVGQNAEDPIAFTEAAPERRSLRKAVRQRGAASFTFYFERGGGGWERVEAEAVLSCFFVSLKKQTEMIP